MDYISDEILFKILDKIEIKTKIKYIPYGDGEQMRTFFYKDNYKYRCNKLFNKYYNNNDKLIINNFFDKF